MPDAEAFATELAQLEAERQACEVYRSRPKSHREGGGGMPQAPETPTRIAELCEILRGFILDLSKVQGLKKRPSLEQRMKAAHAVSQLSAAYLKVAEAEAVLSTVPTLQAQVAQLLAESRNGHGYPTADADLN